MERRTLAEDDVTLIQLLGEDVHLGWLAGLPADQRSAVEAHVIDERSYPDIAGELGTSETVVRMRVSRGLATLRKRIRSPR
jgi:DNA-directed RNA polymerase specialized sigma24 family protein